MPKVPIEKHGSQPNPIFSFQKRRRNINQVQKIYRGPSIIIILFALPQKYRTALHHQSNRPLQSTGLPFQARTRIEIG